MGFLKRKHTKETHPVGTGLVGRHTGLQVEQRKVKKDKKTDKSGDKYYLGHKIV